MSSTSSPTTRAGWIAAGRREPVMFESDGQAVLGVIHRPRRPRAERLPAVAIFHGFVGSKDQPHQIFVKLAEALAAAGIVALRIDFRGRGDSEGDTVDMTFEGDMADARGALDLLAAQPDVDAARLGLRRQFLHAHRLGFTLPSSGEWREFVSPLPGDLQAVLERLRGE